MRVAVVEVGMVPFATPSKSQTYDVLAEGAVRVALTDAGIGLPQVQQVYVGYVNGDSMSSSRRRGGS